MNINITFGIIVLNGEPFTRYCIRALYPHAYEIIISEGACLAAKNVATDDGHSLDGTLELLRELKQTEDPENKIIIVTAEDEGYPDGFWPGEKHEQSKAYAKRATGNYLWQVDIDEFYKDEDILKIRQILLTNPEITAVSFKQLQFWGGFDYIVDSWYLRRGMEEFHRLFKWGKGYHYKTHRPPTVLNDKGQDTRAIKWMNRKETTKSGIFLYHYSFVFPKQIDEKVEYYRNVEWAKLEHTRWWAQEVYYNFKYPFRAFINTNYPGWLEKKNIDHPQQIKLLINDLATVFPQLKIRSTSDLEKIVSSLSYKTNTILLKLSDPISFQFNSIYKSFKRKIKTILNIKK